MQQQCEAQAQDLDHKDTEIAALKAQLTSYRSVKDAEAASLAASNKQLTKQLSQEIARSKTLDGQMVRLQTQLVGHSVQTSHPSTHLALHPAMLVSTHPHVQRVALHAAGDGLFIPVLCHILRHHS
jgi:hypothetical protein